MLPASLFSESNFYIVLKSTISGKFCQRIDFITISTVLPHQEHQFLKLGKSEILISLRNSLVSSKLLEE
jgi:hypothetical protein